MDSFSTNKDRDKLIAGTKKIVTETRLDLTAPGADKTYARGTVLAENTTTNKLVPYVEGGADGVGTFYGLLAEEIDFLTADGDANVVTYIGGQFNQEALTFEGAGDADGIRTEAREKGVFLEAAIYNNDSV